MALIFLEVSFQALPAGRLSSYGYDAVSYFGNNKVFMLDKADVYLLAVLNSPLIWWHNWRYLPHMKDDALSPVGERCREARRRRR